MRFTFGLCDNGHRCCTKKTINNGASSHPEFCLLASAAARRYSMAKLSSRGVCALAVALVTLASMMELSVCSTVKASVSCVDCGGGYDLSGILVTIECDNGKKQTTATTDERGSFEADLPSDLKLPMVARRCLAKLFAGSQQFHALKENMVSEIANGKDQSGKYTISNPLIVSKSCSSIAQPGKCRFVGHQLGSLKTVNLPIPPIYGLPPTSFYVPLFPIIGIP